MPSSHKMKSMFKKESTLEYDLSGNPTNSDLFRKSGKIIYQIPQYLTIPLSGEKTEFWNF